MWTVLGILGAVMVGWAIAQYLMLKIKEDVKREVGDKHYDQWHSNYPW